MLWNKIKSSLELSYFIPALILYTFSLFLPLVTILRNCLDLGLTGWRQLLVAPLFTRAVANTAIMSISIAVITVVLAYALAASIWRASPRGRTVLIFLVVLPFWTSVMVEIVSWQVLLRDNGILNATLMNWHIIDRPLPLLYAKTAVVLGMIQYVLPFAVFPILGVMLRLDHRLEQAAESLGATSVRVFWHIIFPLTVPGVLASLILTFVISIGFYIIPATLGGPDEMMIANTVAVYALRLVDFNRASAVGMVLLVVVGILTVVYHRMSVRAEITI